MSRRMTVLVTGATGFVGRPLCRHLQEQGIHVVAAVREGAVAPPGTEGRVVGDLRGPVDWRPAVRDVDAIVHLAGYVHSEGKGDDQLALARRLNGDATLGLARAAIAAGVKRFVFISSSKVYGEHDPGRPFSEADIPAPENAYGRSKWEAEQKLYALAQDAGMDLIVLRLPLVHGPGVKANVHRMIGLADTPWPLPLAWARNPRSMIGLANVVSAIHRCLTAGPDGAHTYVVRDNRDITVSDMLRVMRNALGRPARLLPMPNILLRLAAALVGRRPEMARLLDPLRVDDTLFRHQMAWQPNVTIEAGLAEMIAAYRQGMVARPTRATAPPATRDELADGVSVIIVSYRTGPEIDEVIDRALADPAMIELVLVDNGNDPVDVTRLRQRAQDDARIVLLTGHGNIGFAAGCNLGVSYSRGRHVLLLNPDCMIEPGSVTELRAVMGERPEPWIATVRLLGHDGIEQRGGRRNLASPFVFLIEGLGLHWLWPARIGRHRLNFHRMPVPNRLTNVPSISGAFMLMPRSTYLLLRGMDEGYFLHVEDLDFCLRLNRAGGLAWFYPHRACMHLKGTSDAPRMVVELHKAHGLRRYFLRHFTGQYPRWLLELVWAVLAGGLLAKAWFRRFIPCLPS